ncbi:MAG: hypothetical protein JWP01_835 [Myxococcales bacterium]|nr:hypothetical protein [Myxococcales bacterium]
MNIKLRLDFEITPRARQALRSVLFCILLPVAVFAGTSSIANAWTSDTTWIASGQPLSSTKLRTVLVEADARLAALEAASVTSSTNLERIERVMIGAGCSSISQSGPWLTLTNNGPGDCTMLFTSGTFSATPTCVGTSNGTNGSWPRYAYVVKVNGLNGTGNPDVSAARVRHMVVDTASAAPNAGIVNEAFSMICIGPR